MQSTCAHRLNHTVRGGKKQHGHTLLHTLTHSPNHKQVCYAHDRPTRGPAHSFPSNQTSKSRRRFRAFHPPKRVSFSHTLLPSLPISKQQFVPIADYPSYLEAISVAD